MRRVYTLVRVRTWVAWEGALEDEGR
eukprot:COSAG02_NODE_51678_length_312_cov_1.211268_2_plen_25_part_01